jgi:hypothetical protein
MPQPSRSFQILAATLPLTLSGVVWSLVKKRRQLSIELQFIVYSKQDEVEEVLPVLMSYNILSVVSNFQLP